MPISSIEETSCLGKLYLAVLYPVTIVLSFLSSIWTVSRPKPPTGKSKPSISFAGCAFLYPYYIGVIEHLLENYEMENVTFVVVSSSCYPVVSLIANGLRPEKWMHKDFPGCIRYWNRRFMGFFWDSPQFLRDLWASSLNQDAYKNASKGNLVIALTRAKLTPPFIQQKLVSNFESNEDLIDCLLASGHIPGMFGFFQTRFQGLAHIDGAFAGSHPVVDSNTVVVDAQGSLGRLRHFFTRNPSHVADVYPSKSYSFSEMVALFGVPEIARCDEMIKDGRRDAAAAEHIFLSRGWLKKKK